MNRRDYLRQRATQWVDEHRAAELARLPQWAREGVRQQMIRKLLSPSPRRLFRDELADKLQTEWLRDYNTTINRPKASRVPLP